MVSLPVLETNLNSFVELDQSCFGESEGNGGASVRGNKFKELSSYKIFQRFVCFRKDTDTGKVFCDASGILSKACYKSWLESRRKAPKKPMEAFRRALTAHCRGVDGRRPFNEEIEVSLLQELRKKKRWSCFEECDDSVGLIGVQGFPSRGFHERQKQRKDRINSFLTSNPETQISEQSNKLKRKFEEETGLSCKYPAVDLEASKVMQEDQAAKLLLSLNSNLLLSAPSFNPFLYSQLLNIPSASYTFPTNFPSSMPDGLHQVSPLQNFLSHEQLLQLLYNSRLFNSSQSNSAQESINKFC